VYNIGWDSVGCEIAVNVLFSINIGGKFLQQRIYIRFSFKLEKNATDILQNVTSCLWRERNKQNTDFCESDFKMDRRR
jgi:hypothetical protein